AHRTFNAGGLVAGFNTSSASGRSWSRRGHSSRKPFFEWRDIDSLCIKHMTFPQFGCNSLQGGDRIFCLPITCPRAKLRSSVVREGCFSFCCGSSGCTPGLTLRILFAGGFYIRMCARLPRARFLWWVGRECVELSRSPRQL